MSYPRQVVRHLFRLVKQLLIVRKMLPPASATHPEMHALWFCPAGRRSYNFQRNPFHVPLLLFRNADVDNVAGNHSRHEEHHLIDLRDSVTLRTYVRYRDAPEYGQLLLSSHPLLPVFFEKLISRKQCRYRSL